MGVLSNLGNERGRQKRAKKEKRMNECLLINSLISFIKIAFIYCPLFLTVIQLTLQPKNNKTFQLCMKESVRCMSNVMG